MPRPNVLLIIADDHRADAIGALGHPTVRTPVLNRLIHEGTAFLIVWLVVVVTFSPRGLAPPR